NTGYGIPNADDAVRLAKMWVNRPPQTNITYSITNTVAIPDAGLRMLLTDGASVNASFVAAPGQSPHVDTQSAAVPIVDVGYATNAIGQSLVGKAALILRGPTGALSDTRNFFASKIGQAAAAGASFVVVYDNVGFEKPFSMGSTDYVPIPA